MDTALDVTKDPPDGAGWWPGQFLVDTAWADDRGTAWRAVINNPTMQARRTGDTLVLRITAGDTTPRTYTLTAISEPPCYLASKEL